MANTNLWHHDVMNYHFYENKIIYILMSVLILIQLAAFFALKRHNEAIIQSTISADLTTGTTVFKRLLEVRNRQLKQSAQVLVSDYGFREAVATKDAATITSTLINHGERAEARLLILSDLNQTLIAATPESVTPHTLTTAQMHHLEAALKNDQLLFLALNLVTNSADKNSAAQHGLFQLVSANVAAPLPIAKLTIGHQIDDPLARDFKNITDMELLFYAKQQQDWQLQASSLPREMAQQFNQHVTHLVAQKIHPLDLQGHPYLIMPIHLSNQVGNEVLVIAAKPLEKLMVPFRKIEQMFLYLLAASIALSLFAIYFVTSRMVRPLNDFAHLDNLTHLGNRRLFNVILDNAILNLNLRNQPFALLMMDLNKFKQVNDTLGHDAGDTVLKELAKRIKHVMRNSDNIARLGGDEFALVVQEGGHEALALIAEKVSSAIAKPIMIGGTEVSVHASIGIAIAPLDSHHKAELIKFADTAMYASKTKQIDFCFYANNA